MEKKMGKKTFGRVGREADGGWWGEIMTEDGGAMFTILHDKRMKDAMINCNIAAKLLGWEIAGWTKH